MSRVSRRLFNVGYFLVLALLLANGLVTIHNLRTIGENDAWIDHTREVVIDLERTFSAIQDAETAQRGYLLTSERAYLKPYEAALERLDDLLGRLTRLTRDNPSQQARLRRLRRLKTAKMNEVHQTISLHDEKGLKPALEVIRTHFGKRVMDQIRGLVIEMAEQEDRLLSERRERSRAASRRAYATFSVATGLALGLLAAVFLVKRQEDQDQARAAESIRRSEAWLQTTLTSIGDGVITVNEEGMVRFLNPAAEAITGWSSNEATGRYLNEVFPIIHEETGQALECPVDRVLRDQRVVSLENHTLLMTRDGSARPIEDSAAPIRPAPGDIQGVVLVFRDASARRQAEQALRRSEERLRLIVESAEEYAIFSIDLDGRIASWNSGARKITGYEPAEIIGQPVKILFIPEDLERGIPSQELKKARELGRAENERWHLRKDGTRFWSSGLVMPMRDSDQVVGWLKIMRDTTEQKRVEEELELSRERFNLVVHSSEVGLWYCDLPFDRLIWNAKCREHFGLPPEGEVTIKTFYERLHPDDRQAARNAIERAIQEHTDYDIEYRTVAPEGRVRWIRAIGHAFYDRQGVPIRFDGVTVDVTQRIEQEQALREADRKKDEFLATLAHELRNPLAPLRNVLHVLAHSCEPLGEYEADLGLAIRQVDHLARLVDDLMDVARISKGKIELKLEPVDLRTIVGRAVESVRSSLQNRHQELAVRMSDEALMVEGDTTRLEQVAGNLINNASKYTEPGGRIEVDAAREGTHVLLRVRDTGIGIAPEMLPHVFDMFVQLKQGSPHSEGGLGIGLGLVKSLVELHGGAIEAQSEGPGRGSAFEVRLPGLGGSPVETPAPRVQAVRSRLEPRRILVVDDNVDAAVTLGRLLSRLHGHHVQVAHDGASALELAERFRPDVAMLDIGMPDMDGYELARRLRARSETASIRLVALTGWGQESDRQRSQEAGFDDHLVKPVDPETVIELIRSTPVRPRPNGA